MRRKYLADTCVRGARVVHYYGWRILIGGKIYAVMAGKPSTSFKLSPEARQLLRQLTLRLGVSQGAIVEIAIRRMAEAEGLEIPMPPQGEESSGGAAQ
jgi:hypothetical protein